MRDGRRRDSNHSERLQRGRSSAYASASTSAFDQGFPSGRARFVVIIFLAIAAIFAIRLVYLQVIVAQDYSQEAESGRTVEVTLNPKRGTIYDRNGRVLATSIEATTVYCNPQEIEDADATAKSIAEILGGKADDYKEALTTEGTFFAYVKRQADADLAEQLRALDLPGIYFLSDSKRVYPNGSTCAQIIGLVNVDGEGLTGLEYYYDDILSGQAGTMTLEQGATGITINGTEQVTDPVAGEDITISIDIDLQQKVEESVTDMASDMEAKSGQAVVLDGATGEILACASTPLLDPTNTENIEDRATECQCITRAFEPGSVFKTATMLAALENGSVTPTESFYCPSALSADEYEVTDAHERSAETMTATDILVRSSNVGISLIAEKMGFDTLNDKIATYGLDATATGVDYPGESAGYLLDFSEWSRIQGYNISFGQGISETPLALCRFYGAIADGGTAYTPHFLISRGSGENVGWASSVISSDQDAISEVTDMLTQVVSEGTGTGAQIEGFTPAGKTGTAEYVEEGKEDEGYVEGCYNNSFVGFLPNTNSKLVCFVGATEVPSETATTETFRDIMSFAIERYNISSTQE